MRNKILLVSLVIWIVTMAFANSDRLAHFTKKIYDTAAKHTVALSQ